MHVTFYVRVMLIFFSYVAICMVDFQLLSDEKYQRSSEGILKISQMELASSKFMMADLSLYSDNFMMRFFIHVYYCVFLILSYLSCRAVVGGSTESNQLPFVSPNALITIFKEVLKKLLVFLRDSSFTWIRDAESFLSSVVSNLRVESENSVNVIEMARFAFDVLEGSFFTLKALDHEDGIVSSILAAVSAIHWELSMGSAIDDTLDDESTQKMKSRLEFSEYVHGFHTKLNTQFWRSLDSDNQKRLGNILIQFIKTAIYAEDNLKTEEMVSLCCSWMLEVLECLGQDQNLEQILLDQLLSKGDSWPLWITPNFCSPKGSTTLNIENVPIDVCVSIFILS